MEETYFVKFVIIVIGLSKTFSCPSKQQQPSPSTTEPPLAPDPRCSEKSAGYFEITGGGLVKEGDDAVLTLCVSEKDIYRDCRFSTTQHESCFYLDNHKAV